MIGESQNGMDFARSSKTKCATRVRPSSLTVFNITRCKSFFIEPVDVRELRQKAFAGGVVEAQGKEAAIVVQRVAKAEGAGEKLRVES